MQKGICKSVFCYSERTDKRRELKIWAEQPIIIMPGLAKQIGLEESIVLQRFTTLAAFRHLPGTDYFELTKSELIQMFPFWAINHTEQFIERLKDMGLLEEIDASAEKSVFAVHPDRVNSQEKETSNRTQNGPKLTNHDMIAELANQLMTSGVNLGAKKVFYAISGRLYNSYDYIASAKAISALKKAIEQKGQIKDPIAFLMTVAKKEKQKQDREQKDIDLDSRTAKLEESWRRSDQGICRQLQETRRSQIREIYNRSMPDQCLGEQVPKGFSRLQFFIEGADKQ